MRSILLFAALVFFASAARAEAPSAPAKADSTKTGSAKAGATRTGAAANVGRRAPKPVEPPPPALPAPSIVLTIVAPSPDAAWTMRVENTGTVPLRLAADARLLTFEVMAPGAKKAVRCALPADMRPHDDEERALVVPPGRAYSEKLDPRLFCFGTRDGAALVPDASVTARLGWAAPKRGKLAPPYAVTPIDGLEPAVAAAKEIASAATTVGPSTSSAKSPDGSRTLAVHTPAYVDVSRGADIALPVTVHNEAPRAVTFLLRTETIAFDVTGPSGIGVTDPSPTIRCEPDADPNTSIRDVFTTLGAKGRTALTVMLAVLCPEHAFDHSGLYVVRARLDTRRASGSAAGLRTFDADVPSDSATRVRIRVDYGTPPPRPRPKLEDPPRKQ